MLIQLKQCEGEEEQSRVFREALKEVPKSGEVWCEGARICMNPLSSKFDLERARQFLDFAIRFTPQYGIHGPFPSSATPHPLPLPPTNLPQCRMPKRKAINN